VWCAYGHPGDYPLDQRPDDALSLTFDTPHLHTERPVSILGFPEVNLTLSSDKPNALIAARLCDVAPDGTSTLITWGLLNLTHRESHANPQPLVPNLQFSISLKLNAIGYTLPAGHKLRLALSNSYWPHAWPSPEFTALTLYSGELSLPTLAAHTQYELPAHWNQPEHAPTVPTETIHPESRNRIHTHDSLTSFHTLRDEEYTGLTEYLPIQHKNGHRTITTYNILEGNPLAASTRCQHDLVHIFGDLNIRIITDTILTSDSEQFHGVNAIEAYENDVRVFNKSWTFSIPRDHV
jgi:uncharacterized protein